MIQRLAVLALFAAHAFAQDAAVYGHAANGALLPSSIVTPGVIRSSSKAEVCAPGYSARMRKLVHTRTLKAATAAYGLKWEPKKREADHLISLELGGEPDDIRNLWPQPYPAAKLKDAVENYLHRGVCAGTITLSEAQRIIATDWTQAGK